jgi:protein TonB
MFANLVESASHQKELKRRGRFLLATLAGYALVVMSLGVVSIYAYDTHMENRDLEFITLLSPVQAEQPAPEARSAAPRAANNANDRNAVAQRTELIDRIADSTKVPDKVSSTASNVPEIPKGRVALGDTNSDPASFGGPGTGTTTGTSSIGDGTNQIVKVDTPPPLPEKPAAPPKPALIKSLGVVNGRATYLPKPAYSPIAKQARAAGMVTVQILIDESGKVISARATSGNPLLFSAAVQAAYQARFTPTELSNVPVKVSGIINYNFMLQ